MKTYSASEAARIIGVTALQVKRWGDAGLVEPDIGGGGERGKHRFYSIRNVFEFAVLHRLHQAAAPTPTIKLILAFLRTITSSSLLSGGSGARNDPPGSGHVMAPATATAAAASAALRGTSDWAGRLLRGEGTSLVMRQGSPWTAVLVHSPGKRPEIRSGSLEDLSLHSYVRAGLTFTIIPIARLLDDVEREAEERFDLAVFEQFDQERAKANALPPMTAEGANGDEPKG